MPGIRRGTFSYKTKQVRSPNENTYCYCPLESDYADHSGNNIAVTSDLTSYGTDMFPWWTGKYVCIPQTNIVTAATNWTVLFRVYPEFKNDWYQTVIAEATTWNSYNFNRWFLIEVWKTQASMPSQFQIWWEAGWAWSTWILLAMTHESAWYLNLSINWSSSTNNWFKYWVDSETSVTNYPMYFWRHVVYTSSSYPYGLKWQIKDIIVETRVWTDQEILNYYNQTKSKYWL